MEKKDENDYYAKLYFTKLKNGKKKYLEINKEWLKYQKQQKSKLETKE
jgi:hypothetical protein